MPRSIKRKDQVKKDLGKPSARSKTSTLSKQNSDTTEDSDSDVKMDLLKPTKISNKNSKGNPMSQDLVDNEIRSSDEEVESQCSKVDIAREDVLAVNVNSPVCSDDVANQVPQKVGKNQTYNNVFDGSSESDDDSDAESRKEILRSAEKRIIRNISTSESDTRNMRVHDKYESSSDSDSAPENVTFEVGRKTAMEVLKQRVDIIRQEKLRKKEQRKKKMENLQKQKEEKLVQLKERQTSVENAVGSSSSESTPKLLENQNAIKNSSLGKKIYFSSESETTERKTKSKPTTGNSVNTKQSKCLKRLPENLLDNLPDQVTQKQQKPDVSTQNSDFKDLQSNKKQIRINNSQMQWDTDYIPLDNSGVTQFGAVPLNTIGLKKKTVAEEAAAFRQNMIYGNKNMRAPANMNSIRQQKLKACGLDRLVTRR